MINEDYGGGGNVCHTVGLPRGGRNDKEEESRIASRSQMVREVTACERSGVIRLSGAELTQRLRPRRRVKAAARR